MFKDIFVHILQERNVSAYKLSKDTGIPQGMISYWRTGKRMPSAESLNVLADYLDCSVDYLLGRGGQEKKTTPEERGELDEKQMELVKLFRAATPELQAAALAVLRSAEGQGKAQGGVSEGE